MKHPFIKPQSLKDDKEHWANTEELCVICKRNLADHGPSAVCENCGSVADCDFKNGILVCSNCASGAPLPQSIKSPDSDRSIHPLVLGDELNKLEQIKTSIGNIGSLNELENKLIADGEYTTIKTAADFFNARTQSIISMETDIRADETIPPDEKHFELARQVRAHYLHLKEVLFSATEIQLKAATEQRADMSYLNQLTRKLRVEEREKLHLESIDYTPKAAPKSVAAPAMKLSKTDKMIQSMADLMKIPFIQAKQIYEGGLKAKGIVCTCKETPGICKVHQ